MRGVMVMVMCFFFFVDFGVEDSCVESWLKLCAFFFFLWTWALKILALSNR